MNKKQNSQTKGQCYLESNISTEKVDIISYINILREYHKICIGNIQVGSAGIEFIIDTSEEKIKSTFLALYSKILGTVFSEDKDSYEILHPTYKTWQLAEMNEYLNNNSYANSNIYIRVDFIKNGVYVDMRSSVGFKQDERDCLFLDF